MDLGLKGRSGIVCAASQGLGKASAMALAREGVQLVIAARRREVLESAADEIASATGNRPKTVLADVTTREGRDAILAACPAPDILVNNAGGPPPGDFRQFERDDWIKALDGNMLAPIALIKATLDGMIARRFGRIVNITSHAVKAPVAMLALSNGARSRDTQGHDCAPTKSPARWPGFAAYYLRLAMCLSHHSGPGGGGKGWPIGRTISGGRLGVF